MSRRLRLLLLCAASVPVAAGAQLAGEAGQSSPSYWEEEWWHYARVLQANGDVSDQPWSVRPFTSRQLRALDSGQHARPWGDVTRPWSGLVWFVPLPVETEFVFNSSFPFGYNDGPVWAGRGITSVAQAGIVASAGPLTITLHPIFFRSENTAFQMRDNGLSGDRAFGDPFNPIRIDQPQRFGADVYQRTDPGNSAVELDARWLVAGISTASEQWGPARDHPLILGNNAGGFEHVYFGTATPLNIWIGKVHARMLWGRLEQTPYALAPEGESRRFASGIVAVFTPRGLPGLELGGSRFFHQIWPDSGLVKEDFLRPLSGLLKASRIAASGNGLGNEPDNQLASAFFRWVVPRSGFEFYGEYARDDHNVNLRDLAKEPDHIAAYVVGAARVWRHDSTHMTGLRGEIANSRISALQLVRSQAPFYVHVPVTQGHTLRGQTLGSFAAYGGGGATLALDRYSPSGRWTIGWSRLMRAERPAGSGVPRAFEADVFETLGVDGIRFMGRYAATYELTGVYELNRDFRRDAFNLRAATGVRIAW